jgi:hypothetical protein
MLELKGLDGRPCVVVGSRRGNVFGGGHQDRSQRVRAKWFKAGALPDVWVGVWIVNAKDHVFLFDLRPYAGRARYGLTNFEQGFNPADFERLEKLPELRDKFKKIENSPEFQKHMERLYRLNQEEVDQWKQAMLKLLKEQEKRGLVPDSDEDIDIPYGGGR